MKELDFKQFSEAFNSCEAGVFAFGAPWCRDCIKAAPWLTQLASKYPNISFYHCDVDKNEGAREALSIRHIPTIIFAKKGTEVHERIVEPTSIEQLETALKSLL